MKRITQAQMDVLLTNFYGRQNVDEGSTSATTKMISAWTRKGIERKFLEAFNKSVKFRKKLPYCERGPEGGKYS